MKQKNILYISDLDGTLLNRQDRLSEYSMQTINQLIEEGMNFTYATARSLSSASIVTKGLNLKLPVIVYNGTFLMDAKTGEAVYSLSFTKEQREFIKKTLMRHNLHPLIYTFFEGREKVCWHEKFENAGLRRYLGLRRGDKRMTPLLETQELYQGEIFYFTCIGEKEELEALYEELKQHPEYNCIFQQELYREEYWCEIMPKKSTKANAILEMKRRLGFEKVISFGDAVNDLPMFRISDECYAVENAVEEVKKAAGGIIGSNEADGLAHWLYESVK